VLDVAPNRNENGLERCISWCRASYHSVLTLRSAKQAALTTWHKYNGTGKFRTSLYVETALRTHKPKRKHHLCTQGQTMSPQSEWASPVQD
jgi:hypothetical protein